MSSLGGPGEGPPPFPGLTDSTRGSAHQDLGGADAAYQVDSRRIWVLAFGFAAFAYGALIALHLSTDGSGSIAFRTGQMLPIAAGSAVVVALIALATSNRRPWPWWLMGLAVLTMCAIWYSFVYVLPRVVADARAEPSGQVGHSLQAAQRAGEWVRQDGPEVTAREDELREGLKKAPQEIRETMRNFVYAEYVADGPANLVFIGINATGALEDELRRSTDDALRDLMAGAGASDAESVGPGKLGGYMACTTEGPGLRTGMAYCAWADTSTVGQITIVKAGLRFDEAADFARKFRGRVTSR